jgi:error-prone DNA polymerase
VKSEYIELRTRSAFSFLEGASNPEELVDRAASLGYPALALADLHGVYGAPRFHRAASEAGIHAIVGAELSVEAPVASTSLLLLAETPEGWRRLSRLITLGHQQEAKSGYDGGKGECRSGKAGRRGGRADRRGGKAERHSHKAKCSVDWPTLEEHARDLTVLIRGDERLSPAVLDRARGVFGNDPERLWVDVSRHLDRHAESAARRAVTVAEGARVPVVATGDVRCAAPRGRALLDALTCLRWKTTLDGAGRRLLANGERFLQDPASVEARFADRPEWVAATRRIAERCAFTLDALDYRFPEYPLEPGETQAGRLRGLTLEGARTRYGHPLGARVRRQLEHELAVIEKLDLAGYFLIVHDIADYARRHRILCQGRGSAANSAVCYALGITAVDPVGMELLFERFLSEERGEWPDIDLDLPSGDQRERVIQYVFDKYGRQGAAMTANVITYRIKLAVREMGKVVGLAPDTVDRLAKQLSRLHGEDGPSALVARLGEAGVDPGAPRIEKLVELVTAVQGLPRHLGQHSGGIVIAAGRLDEVVPIEPASMPNRRVVQWDKDDCADRGIIKIDLLGLGMLAALEETIPLIRHHEDVRIDLSHLPADDPDTYAMMRRADTVGVFQIESRAQMATLPRLKPRTFYDLVVEIAIIRPGPIVGQMVHPYLNRRAGREPVTYPHPSLEPILKRTLGVPIFQEQLLRVAMTAAGFSGGEAEELRRAMGFKRSIERMDKIEAKLREGMEANGIGPEAQDEIVRHITSFALYGFPESHSASFALIAYASAYLKCHHPAAFLVGLLNAWPMGFYNPATLVKDAQRHGVEVRPIDVMHSHWSCSLEPGTRPRPAVRIGLRFASGFRQKTAEALKRTRDESPFTSLADMVRRIAFRSDELDALAELGALAELEGTPKKRRAALWQVAAIERDPSSLFAGQMPREEETEHEPLALNELSELDTTLADYRLAGLTTGPQVMAHLRTTLHERGVLTAEALKQVPDGRRVRTAGHVIVRQRPGSAKGFLFLTLEDETGLSNAIMTPKMVERFRAPLQNASLVEIGGKLQNVDGVVHVRLDRLVPLDRGGHLPPSRSYR